MATKKAKKVKSTEAVQLETPSGADFIEDTSGSSDLVTKPDHVQEQMSELTISTPVEVIAQENPPDGSPAPGLFADTVFHLEGISRTQDFSIRSGLVLADCSVQQTPDRVFDVLARNFDSTGATEWWLHRIGLGSQAKFVKGKDLVDALRKLSYELHKLLKKEIGRPVARW